MALRAGKVACKAVLMLINITRIISQSTSNTRRVSTRFTERSCGQDDEMCGGMDIRMVGWNNLLDNMDELSFLRCWVDVAVD